MPFDVAIRVYLDSFRLPGESQKINRIMESFGARYHMQCPDLFKNPDVVYILAYSTIMLNTDQHNSQVRNAPSCCIRPAQQSGQQSTVVLHTRHHHRQVRNARLCCMWVSTTVQSARFSKPASCPTPASTVVRSAMVVRSRLRASSSLCCCAPGQIGSGYQAGAPHKPQAATA